MDPSTVATGLASNPLAWGLALSLGAIGYLFKQPSAEREARAKDLADSQAKLIEQLRVDAKDQREILSQILPLSTKLSEGLEILVRVTDQITEGCPWKNAPTSTRP